jgi:hypothetical protein
MAFSITDIRANLKLGGARPTLFEVLLDAPAGFDRELTNAGRFMIQASSLPGSTISPIEVPYFGRKIRVAGDRTFEPWSVQVLNDEDFKVRHSLESWHNRINSLAGNLNSTGTSAPANYKAQAEIRQYSKAGGTPIRTYKYFGLFPTEISPIDVNWNDTDTIETFQATFVYDYYEVVNPGNTGTLS